MPTTRKPAKKVAAKQAPQEVIGPSSEPKDPIVTINSPVTAPVVRAAGQGITGGLLVEGITVFNLATLTEAQSRWLTVTLGILIAFGQNMIEARRGRRLIGAAR